MAKIDIVGDTTDKGIFYWKLYINNEYIFSSFEDNPINEFRPFIEKHCRDAD